MDRKRGKEIYSKRQGGGGDAEKERHIIQMERKEGRQTERKKETERKTEREKNMDGQKRRTRKREKKISAKKV